MGRNSKLCQNEELYELLAKRALDARAASYCPYSNFAVGAALLCEDGSIYTGCNVECASFSAGACAERTAFLRAIHKGKRNFLAIAVAGGFQGEEPTEFCPPCGVCRQFMREFCGSDFEIVLTDGKELQHYLLGELFPVAFGPEHLGEI